MDSYAIQSTPYLFSFADNYRIIETECIELRFQGPAWR